MSKVHTERYASYDRALIRLNDLIKDGHTAYLSESEDGSPHRIQYIENNDADTTEFTKS